MAEVSIKVGGRHYQMACDDGQEGHLRALAARLDTEAQALAGSGKISEARLMLMVALMMADQLDEAEEALRSTPPSAPATPADTGDGTLFNVMNAGDEAAGLVAEIDQATSRIAALNGGAAPPPEGSGRDVPTSDAPDAAASEDDHPDSDGATMENLTPFERRALRRAKRAAQQ
ncbi:MAG: cell division protein ZapA [Pseudomonadota bacterium]